MSSRTYDLTLCPQCCHIATVWDYSDATSTAILECFLCGYAYRVETALMPSPYGVDNSAQLEMREREWAGTGGYYLYSREGYRAGCLHTPITDRVKSWFSQQVQQPGIEAAHSFLSEWNPLARQVEAVLGTLPSPYSSCYNCLPAVRRGCLSGGPRQPRNIPLKQAAPRKSKTAA